VIDFMNLKIKPTQSFRGAHRGRMCVRVFIGVSARTCMSIYVCTMFLKKEFPCTNNQSEYEALLMGREQLHEMGVRAVDVFGDSRSNR
jgi:hypothetical protein